MANMIDAALITTKRPGGLPMRIFAIVAVAALGLLASSPAWSGGYYPDPRYDSCDWGPYWGYSYYYGPLCKRYAYRPVGYRSYAGSYSYVPGFSNAPRHRLCRTFVIETPNGQHQRIRRCH